METYWVNLVRTLLWTKLPDVVLETKINAFRQKTSSCVPRIIYIDDLIAQMMRFHRAGAKQIKRIHRTRPAPGFESPGDLLWCWALVNLSTRTSRLELIKNYLRLSISQDRFSSLAILSVESKIANLIDFDDVIKDLESKKARKII